MTNKKTKQRKRMTLVLAEGQVEYLSKLVKGNNAILIDLEVLGKEQEDFVLEQARETDLNRRKE